MQSPPHCLQQPLTGHSLPSAVQVVSRTNIQVGDWVRVFINDASTGVPDPVRKLQQAAPQDAGAAAVAAAAAATPGKYKVGNVTLITQEPPAWVKRSAAYRAAMSGRRWLREEGESGLTVAQALEAERVWAARRAQAGGGTDAAGANAAAGTIAAWIYRENMADSGDPGTVQKDEVSVIAK